LQEFVNRSGSQQWIRIFHTSKHSNAPSIFFTGVNKTAVPEIDTKTPRPQFSPG
jgi:hypothetical protein